MELRFNILLVELGVALIIQIGLLLGIFVAIKRSAGRMESLADEFQRRAMPTMETVQGLITKVRPQIEVIAENAAQASTTVRSQVEKLDVSLNEFVDRARVHAARADDLIGKTFDRVEETSEVVQNTVMSPVRQVSGILQGLSTGLNVLLKRSRRNGSNVQDEMFI